MTEQPDPSRTLTAGNIDAGLAAELTDAPVRLEPGTRVGRFVIVGTAGGGGMGVVYAAYDPELDRKIALKLVRVGATDSTSASAGRLRLQREAQAMARLSHPNVVTVHDVGVFDKQVFIAMEFVEGQTLAQWLKSKPRSWRELLRVFRHAGEGLAAAHSAGIIHRDFKPANVLIGTDGRLRVMDFGLARATKGDEVTAQVGEAQGTDAQPGLLDVGLTRVGSSMGTPAYMAPEQHEGRDVDAKADQYGFCVALYEALYGERPFAGRTLDELAANVLAGRIAPTPKNSNVASWLRRAVLRGLAVDPAGRYPDMRALLATLERDPAAVRRRWVTTAAALILVGALGLGVRGWMKRQSRLCKGAGAKLAGVWDAPRKKAVEAAFRATEKSYAADTWARVEKALDEYARQWLVMHTESCEATQLRGEQSAALMDLRMACLDGRLKQVQALVSVFAEADATVVEKAAQAAQALPRLSRCADREALSAAIPPPEDDAIRQEVEELRDTLIKAKALEDAGKYAAGLELASTVTARAKRLDYAPAEAEALFRLGSLQERSGGYQEAESALREAWWAAATAHYHEVEAWVAIDLIAVVGFRLGRVEEAEQLSRHAGAIVKGLKGKEELEVKWLNNTGTIAFRRGDYRKAQEYHERALAIGEKAMGPEHTYVGASLNDLGNVFGSQGDYEAAHKSHERALAIFERTRGPEHPDVARALNNLGIDLNLKGQYDKAQSAFERALTIYEKALGQEHPSVALSVNNLGQVLVKKGEYARAQAASERALSICKARSCSPGVVPTAQFNVAVALWGTRRGRSHAVELARRARAGYAKLPGMKGELAEVDDWLARHVKQQPTKTR